MGLALHHLLRRVRHGFNLQPDPLGRGLEAARRAADAAPSNALAHIALALVQFFRKESQAFRHAAEQPSRSTRWTAGLLP